MRMRWTGNVACTGEKMNSYGVLVGKSEGNRPVGYLEVNGGMILKWIVQKYDGSEWTGCMWLRTGTSEGLL
jgi:hypothetical protein